MVLSRTRAAGFVLLLGSALGVYASSSDTPDFYPGMKGMASCLACHKNGAGYGGPGSVELSGVPVSYDPGKVYTVTMKVKQPGSQRFGFELYAVDQGGAQAGKIITDDLQQDVRIQKGVTFLKQSFNGRAGNGERSWTFQWKAPEDPSTRVGFYAEALASDSSGTVTGDTTYKIEAVSVASSAQQAPLGLHALAAAREESPGRLGRQARAVAAPAETGAGD